MLSPDAPGFFPLWLHRAQAEETDARADLPFPRLRAGADLCSAGSVPVLLRLVLKMRQGSSRAAGALPSWQAGAGLRAGRENRCLLCSSCSSPRCPGQRLLPVLCSAGDALSALAPCSALRAQGMRLCARCSSAFLLFSRTVPFTLICST